jgi:hypothetical protein
MPMAKGLRRIVGTALTTSVWIAAYAPLAHAHGGMVGPDELGPPLTIAFLLAFAGYWLMILWPAAKSREENKSAESDALRIRKPATRGTRRADPFRQHPVRLVKKVTSNDSSGTVER